METPTGTGQSIWQQCLRSPIVRLLASLITAFATYLQYAQAGLTLWFWVFCLLTVAAGVAVVPAAAKTVRKRKLRAEMRRRSYDLQQRVEALTGLIDEFADLEKARSLLDDVTGNARVVAVLFVEGGPGVMLNVGRREALQVGTRFLVYRVDRYTSGGEPIEEPLAIVRVAYVQAGNNCSQAVVLQELDAGFWHQSRKRLEQEKSLEPPSNIAVPYVPRELEHLSLEDLVTFRRYLETIRDSLTHTVPD